MTAQSRHVRVESESSVAQFERRANQNADNLRLERDSGTLCPPLPSSDLRAVTSQNFGLLIAYILPGFVTLWGLSHVSETVNHWLGSDIDGPTVGGFLYVTLASVGAGLTVSTLRWLVIDAIHHRTGIVQPDWDYSKLASRTTAFTVMVEDHYRFYNFYANGLIAGWFAMPLRWIDQGVSAIEFLALVCLSVLFWLGSRDTLRRYYRNVDQVLAIDKVDERPASLDSDAAEEV